MRLALAVVLLAGCHDWSVFDHLDLGASVDASVAADLAMADLAADDLAAPIDLASLDLTEGADWRPLVSNVSVNLRSVWGFDDNDVWIVGDAGTVLHSTDGVTWAKVNVGVTVDLYAVSCTVGAMWIVGDGNTILRGTGGTSFAPPTNNSLPSTTYNDVIAFDSTHACAGGDQGIHCTSNGADWSRPVGGAAILTIHGTSPTDDWALGNGTANYHNGTQWINLPSAGNVEAVWETDASHVFAVGPSGNLATSTGGGNAFTQTTLPGMHNLHGVFGIGTNVHAVGDAGYVIHTTDGVMWSSEDIGGIAVRLRGIWGTATALYAVGDGGTILKHK